MFNLTARHLGSTILDCASGPASFNAEMPKQCDPIYRLSAADVSFKIEKTFSMILANAEENRANFLWDEIQSPQHLGKLRKEAMQQFLADFGSDWPKATMWLRSTIPFPDEGIRSYQHEFAEP